MHGHIDHWSIQRSRSLQGEFCASLDGQFVQVNLSNSRKIEIPASEVEPESVCRRREAGIARDFGILMRETNVAQRGFSPSEVKIGIELGNLLAVRGSIRRE